MTLTNITVYKFNGSIGFSCNVNHNRILSVVIPDNSIIGSIDTEGQYAAYWNELQDEIYDAIGEQLCK